jgi:hypothetical protein
MFDKSQFDTIKNMVVYNHIKKCILQKHIRASNLQCRFIRVDSD